MEFNKALDGLPQIAKILLAIFVPIIGLIYRIINDCANGVKTVPLVLDILGLFLFVPAFIAWVMDIIDSITANRFFLWEDWIK
jgi:hypothetical protein